jgi:hypothetical protein
MFFITITIIIKIDTIVIMIKVNYKNIPDNNNIKKDSESFVQIIKS